MAPAGAVSAGDCLRRIDIRGLDDAGLRGLHCGGGAGGRAQACAGGWGDGCGGVVRCRRARAGPAAADDPSSCGGRGVVAHPGAGPCGGVGGDCARQSAGAGAAGNLVSRLGAAAGVACTRLADASGSLRSGAGCWVRRRWRWSRARSILSATSTARPGGSRSRCRRRSRRALLTRVPAAFHGGINDVLLTGLVVAIADWCRRHGRAVGLCGAARSGGTWARGGVRGCRPVGHGGVVHQPVPGAARSRRARCRGGDGGRRRARARAQEHQGTAARAARQWARLWCAALLEPADGRSA